MSRPGKTDVSPEQNKKNTEKNKEIEKEINEYKRRYKNILWIDDDCGDDAKTNYEWLTKDDNLKDKKDADNIKTIKKFSDAVKEIDEHSSNYDLVIFDMNMNKGITDYIDDDAEIIKKVFSRNNIKCSPDDLKNKDKKRYSGEYLYLLLLSKGYPKNRMIIYTNNYEKYLKSPNTVLYNLFDFNECGNLFIDKSHSIEIDSYFSEDSMSNGGYYRIRRLIYQACEYWKEYWEENKSNPIPFNVLYEIDVDRQSFLDMLEQIEMMFPVIKPITPKEVYYQAMHIVSMFHEEKANFSKADKNGIRPYHQMIRNFRNWSSHNKFKSRELSSKQFALLFCVALRTYFDKQKHPKTDENGKTVIEYNFNGTIYPYENVYFKDIKAIDWENEGVNDIIKRYWKEMLKNIECYGGRKESFISDIEMSTLLKRRGEQEKKMPFSYINLSMFKSPFVKIDSYQISDNRVEPTGSDKVYSAKIIIEYQCEQKELEESLFNGESDKLFEKIAFELLSEKPTDIKESLD